MFSVQWVQEKSLGIDIVVIAAGSYAFYDESPQMGDLQ